MLSKMINMSWLNTSTWHTYRSTSNHISPSMKVKQHTSSQSVVFTTELMIDFENSLLVDVAALTSLGLISYLIIQSPIPWRKYTVHLKRLVEPSWNVNNIVKYDTYYNSWWSRSHPLSQEKGSSLTTKTSAVQKKPKENVWCSDTCDTIRKSTRLCPTTKCFHNPHSSSNN